MTPALATFRDRILAADTFGKAVLSGPPEGLEWRRVQIRLVELKQGLRWQVSRFTQRQDFTKNHDAAEMPAVVDELLGLGFRHAQLEDRTGTLELTVLPNGKVKTKSTGPSGTTASSPARTHDRPKESLLAADAPPPFVRALGFLTDQGVLKADYRDKYKQINEFLRLIDETGFGVGRDRPLRAVDFGCGNAYLTFALYHHWAGTRGLALRLTGVDLKQELMDRHRHRAADLGFGGLDFVPGTIQDYHPTEPADAVVALHACDTATDDALAQGIAWKSGLIVVAPCCQHHLQVQLDRAEPPASARALLRYGLVGERVGDLLTDTFRALLLRLHGYSVDVVPFVDAAHTPKNLMIRAVRTGAPAPASVQEEYEAMKAYWGVKPYLESRLEPVSN